MKSLPLSPTTAAKEKRGGESTGTEHPVSLLRPENGSSTEKRLDGSVLVHLEPALESGGPRFHPFVDPLAPLRHPLGEGPPITLASRRKDAPTITRSGSPDNLAILKGIGKGCANRRKFLSDPGHLPAPGRRGKPKRVGSTLERGFFLPVTGPMLGPSGPSQTLGTPTPTGSGS